MKGESDSIFHRLETVRALELIVHALKEEHQRTGRKLLISDDFTKHSVAAFEGAGVDFEVESLIVLRDHR
jgi:hypothetical protein